MANHNPIFWSATETYLRLQQTSKVEKVATIENVL